MKRQVGLKRFLSRDVDIGPVPSSSNSHMEESSKKDNGDGIFLAADNGEMDLPPTSNYLPPSTSSQNEENEKSGSSKSPRRRKKRKSEYVVGRAFKKEWAAEFPDIESVEYDGVESVKCKVCTWAFRKEHLIQCKYDNIVKHHGKKKVMKTDENGKSYEVVEFCPENKHQKNLQKYEAFKMRARQVEEKSTPLHLMFSEQDKKEFRTKSVQMKAIFFLLKSGRPMTQYPEIRELFLSNELPLCPLYHWSIPAGWEFAGFMNEALKSDLRDMVENSEFLSLSFDEVTAVDNTNWAAMHLYNVVEYQRKSHYLGIFKLSTSSNAETLYNVIVDHISNVVGMSARDCAKKLICFGADGASVMQGSRSGLGVRIQTHMAPYLQVIHCMSHRTNLAYKVISDFSYIAKVELLVQKAYKFFSKSPQRCAAFKSLAEGLTDGKRILKNVSTRWISLYGPVKRLCEEYASLIACADEFTCSDDGATVNTATELYNLLVDGETILTLFALEPLLHKLHYLISISQDGNIFIPEYNIARKSMQVEIEQLYIDDPNTRKTCFERHKVFSMWRKLVQIGSIESFLACNERGILCAHVRDKYMELTMKKPRGRANRLIKAEFQYEDFGYVVDKVKHEMKEAANALANELRSRFPPDEVLDAIGVVFPHNWNSTASSSKSIALCFKSKMKIIKQYFCCEKSFSDGRIDGLLDYQKLKAQGPLFGDTMVKRFKDLKDPLEFGAVTRLWELLGSNSLLRVAISEYFRLAELCLCMVLGSVQDERCFSTLSFLKNKLRNRLDDNLDATLRLYACDYSLYDFPYERVFELWNDTCKRRSVTRTYVAVEENNTNTLSEVQTSKEEDLNQLFIVDDED